MFKTTVFVFLMFICFSFSTPSFAGKQKNYFPDSTSVSAKIFPMSSQSFKNFLPKKKKIKIEKESGEEEGKRKFDEPGMFVQYQKTIRTREGESAPKYSANYLMEELGKAQAQSRLNKTTALSWIERGPGNVSGRTRGLIVDAADATNKTWFAGSVSGGVWKTTDAGVTWTPKTPDLPNLATTVLAQAPSNPNIIYCGTGEGFYNVDAVHGSGIFKSIDHGESWTQLSSTVNFNFYCVNRIIVSPTDPNILLACTTRGQNRFSNPAGIWRSINGGSTWTKVYSTSYDAVEDLISDPVDFSIQYATVNNDGIYKSTDAGLNWAKKSGVTTSGRIEICVSRKNPNYLYASSEMKDGTDDASGLFVSENKGEKWYRVFSADGLTKHWLGSQGWYDNTIAVHPYDEKTVFFAGIDIWKAQITSLTDTSRIANFYNVSDGYGSYGKPYVHVDHHNLTMIPINQSTGEFWILNGNDGGVAFSSNGGSTWKGNSTDYNNASNNGGYNTTQFYGVDKKPGANEYIGGTQDNGTFKSSGASNPPSIFYDGVMGGDGFDAVWHHKDPNKIIGSSQYNDFSRTTDGGNNWTNAAQGLEDVGESSGCFISRIAESNSDADVIFTTGSRGIWRSEDFGGTWIKSAILSGTWEYSRFIIPVAISIADPQIVWGGASFSNSSLSSSLFLSIDGGVSFSNVNPYSGVSLGKISGIDTHPTNSNTAFLTFSIASAPKILRTTDRGISWNDITGFGLGSSSSNGFPDVATYCVLVMPYNTNIIWVGTEIGLFESTDNGSSWLYASNGLPAVCVWDMKIVDDQVVVATHGRGIWSVTLSQLSGYQPPATTYSPAIISFAQAPDKSISIKASLRSVYDSTWVIINNKKILALKSAFVKDTSLKFIPTVYGTTTAQVISYKSSKQYVSSIHSIEIYDLQSIKLSYSNNFNLPSDDFAGNGFTISTTANFNSPAINSLHPYGEMTNYYYTLKIPIRITTTPALAYIEYDDVALVEPGDPGSVFGSSDFYDYVALEGSLDGATWLPIEEGYDCRFTGTPSGAENGQWYNLYSTGASPTSTNYVHHKLNLLKNFHVNDVIFIRLHLFSDPFVTGWGWILDNLSIQPGAVNVETENVLPDKYVLYQNYPNPFNPVTTIRFELPVKNKVKLEIFDLLGRLVTTLVDKELDAGTYRFNWNATNFSSGVYIYRVTTDKFSDSKKLMLVK